MMKKVNENTMREITGGRWKCHSCGSKFKIWLALFSDIGHSKCTGTNFGYHWVW